MSKLQRVCAVIGVAGFTVFLLAAMAVYPENRWIVEPIAGAGLAVAFLAGLVAGLHWALTDHEDGRS